MIAGNPKRVTALLHFSIAFVSLAAAAAVYLRVVPIGSLRPGLVVFSLLVVATVDVVMGVVLLLRS